MKLRNVIKESMKKIKFDLSNLSNLKKKRYDRERKKDWSERRRGTISTAKSYGPDQNAINLTNIELSDACKCLLSKGLSFVPTPYDINWYI